MSAVTTLPWGRPLTRDDLVAVLTAHVVRALEVMVGPLDVVRDESTVLQPDVLVASRDDVSDRDLPRPPLLAVDVLAPIDLVR